MKKKYTSIHSLLFIFMLYFQIKIQAQIFIADSIR